MQVKVNLMSSTAITKKQRAMPTESPTAENWISIRKLARPGGLARSALRFYEEQGLLVSQRSDSGRRQFARSKLRRVAFVCAALAVCLSLEQIRAVLAGLPNGRTPTPDDWQRLSCSWQPLLDERIAELTRLRNKLTSCIGCGCLSLAKCSIYDTGD